MPTLYIDRKGAEVQHCDGRLIVAVATEPRVEFPMQLLERVVIRAGCRMETATLAELGRRGIPVAIPGPGRSARATVLVSATARDGLRRLAQTRTYLDGELRLRLARLVVRAKLRSQRSLLERERGGLREFAMRKGIAALSGALARPEGWIANAELLGAEGAGARAYFHAFRTLFAPGLGFHDRNRRPPRDPVNACLSLGYTLLYSRLTGELATQGFDPFIGFLHEPAAGRASLACDFVELQRTRIDAMVLKLFRERALRPEHFTSRDSGCVMGKAGRQVYYQAWEEAAAGVDRRALRAMRLLARWIDRVPAEAPQP